MFRWTRMAVVALVALGAACDRPESVVSPTESARLTAAEKIGPAVLEALRRGEQPAITVSLYAERHASLDRMRSEVAEAQDGVLRRVPAQEITVRRRRVR
jgi:hypothetical protein